jgi:cell division septum initiation protein DivIVA
MARSENAGLGLFEDTASAAGNFPGALRGYDRQAVDEYVRTLEASVVQSRSHAAELEKQVTGLQDQLQESKLRETDPDDVDYAGLGGRANEILRLAQEQAHDLTTAATLEGERIREEARRDAAQQREQAERDSGELRTGGLSEISELRTRLQDEVAGQVARAQAESSALLEAARREGASLRLQAEHEVATMRNEARLETDTLRTEVEREVAEARAELAREREETLARVRGEHDDLAAQTRAMLAEAAEHHTQSTGRLEGDIAESARIRAEAAAEAEQVRGNAIAEAENRIATARKQAAAITARTQQEFSWRKQQLRRETELLQQRKQAVLSQLASLSELAQQTASSFPDLDEDADQASDQDDRGQQTGSPTGGATDEHDVPEDGDDRTVLKRYSTPTLPQDGGSSEAPTSGPDGGSADGTSTGSADTGDDDATTVRIAVPQTPAPEDDAPTAGRPAGTAAPADAGDTADTTVVSRTTGDDGPSEGGSTGTDDDGLDIPMDGEPTLLAAPGRLPSVDPSSGRDRKPRA